jgi:hypothetical protein
MKCTMAKTASRIITTDAQIDEAIARGKSAPIHRAVRVAYNSAEERIDVSFADGMFVGFPRRVMQGLNDAAPTDLAEIRILGPGTALYWPRLDIGHDINGLLDGVFGTRRWMAELGRRGGSVKSEKKAAAARKAGSLGGRPRKKGTSTT